MLNPIEIYEDDFETDFAAQGFRNVDDTDQWYHPAHYEPISPFVAAELPADEVTWFFDVDYKIKTQEAKDFQSS